MSAQPVSRSDDDRGVTTLVVDVPGTRNALGITTLGRINEELRAVAGEPAVRVVVIAPAGPVFCSGADRSDIAAPAGAAHVTALLSDVLRRIDGLSQPVICRVGGAAYGAGLAILAAADISIGVPDARFALPEVRFGMAATVAAAACLPRLGEAATLDLMLTGRSFDGREAHRLGLLTAVVAAADLDAAIEATVCDVLLGAPAAIAVSKRVARRLGGATLSQRLALAADISNETSEGCT